MNSKDTHIIIKESVDSCNNCEEVETERISNETKLLTRVVLPIGAIEEIEKKEDNAEMEMMDALWKTLVNKVEEKNNNQTEIAEDKHVIGRTDKLKKHSDESHRLSMLVSDEAMSRIKKRTRKEFCCWERQANAEVKRLRKMREKEKRSAEKHLASGDGAISDAVTEDLPRATAAPFIAATRLSPKISREENASEVLLEVEKENDMSLAVKESVQMTRGKLEEKAVEQFACATSGTECRT